MRLALALTLAAMASPVAAQDLRLRLPVACEIGRTCHVQNYVDRDPGPAIVDYQCGRRTYEGHNGVDIRVPNLAAQRAGVDVLAAADGTVLNIRNEMEDVSVKERGLGSVARMECGNGAVVDHGNGWHTQYCHMARGSLAVKPGDRVRAGDRLGAIGLSGLTEYPHLHFTLRKDGQVVDPFRPGPLAPSCERSDQTGLWEPAVGRALAYQAGAVLNKGFAPGPVTMEAIETGTAEREVPNTGAPALVAFVRAIALRTGDVQALVLVDPDGKPLARNQAPALESDKAQWMMFAGVRAPPGGFRPGLYRALYRVEREGRPVIEQAFAISLRP
ncbi:MAG TPA: M23 family metallopeptidase [Microvirga sp.]|jgi:hypothetical protein